MPWTNVVIGIITTCVLIPYVFGGRVGDEGKGVIKNDFQVSDFNNWVNGDAILRCRKLEGRPRMKSCDF